MAELSNMQDLSNIVNETVNRFSLVEPRLDLIHRYKKHCDPAIKISPEQLKFVNGFMQPKEVAAFVLRYELAIAQAIEVAEASAREARLIVRTRNLDTPS
jgi:hypothetical protein